MIDVNFQLVNQKMTIKERLDAASTLLKLFIDAEAYAADYKEPRRPRIYVIYDPTNRLVPYTWYASIEALERGTKFKIDFRQEIS